MDRVKVLQEIRLMRFSEVYRWWSEKRLSQIEAARMFGMCERTFRRH